ncbi:hypothetical protein mRhiFer1_010078 [Rhinolophus ferrumequinum]|uniref:Uncharacterized protein n=1 Tax=Rhinolophus ferrumequinum TaxID=59479 RepID=A0A7J7Y5B2_RHIFE|nr:hypothetical protein mRhiFer1_010078 [Rhinolophus ferrumequinum]
MGAGFCEGHRLGWPPGLPQPCTPRFTCGAGGVSDCPAGKVVLPSAFQGLCTHQVSSAHQVLTEQVCVRGLPGSGNPKSCRHPSLPWAPAPALGSALPTLSRWPLPLSPFWLHFSENLGGRGGEHGNRLPPS